MAANWLEKLVTDGSISQSQLTDAEQMASELGIKTEEALVKLDYVTSSELGALQAAEFGYDFINLEGAEIQPGVIEMVPESVAREHLVIPIALDGENLVVAIGDPMNFEVLDKLRFILNREINVAVAPEDAIQTAINRHYGQSETESVDSMLQEFTETAIDFTQTEITEAETMAEGDDDSAPIIRLVDLIVSEAVTMRASDIHVEPFEDRVRVRYRIDGVLVERDLSLIHI